MHVDTALVQHLAYLSRLEFSESESKVLEKDLKKILDLVNTLNHVDTKNVEPLIQIHDAKNIFREDVDTVISEKNSYLNNAPTHNQDFFLVPKVINK